MATLFKRSGKYYISYMYDGKRKKKSLKTDKRRIAEKKFAVELERINNDEIGMPQKNRLLLDYISEYDELLKVFKSESLYIRYNQIIRWFTDFIERSDVKYIRNCNQEHIEYYLKERRKKGISPKTFNEELRLLANLFNTAIEKGYCKVNPCKNVPKMKYIPPPARFFSNDELELLYENASSRFRDMWMFLANTGLRLGELKNLEWTDVDFENNLVEE